MKYNTTLQEQVSYIHTELDEDYVNRLRQMISLGHVVFKTEDLPPSLIKDIYEVEGVTHSIWFHISNEKLTNSKAVAITYCSFATHGKELNQQDIIRCRLVVGRLKELSSASNPSQT